METSYFGDKILDLQTRLRAENEANQRENIANDLSINALCSPRYGAGRRPKQLIDDMGTPTRRRKPLDLPVCMFPQPKAQDTEVDTKMKEIMKMNGILTIEGKQYHTDIKDLEHIGELGNGTCGQVVKMLHKPSNTVIAVKQMRRSGNSDENKRIIMDLDVVFKSLDCPYIVRYLGCFITESDVWICMELMATCFDRLLKKLRAAIPEHILGKVTLATVKALHYLKESHGIIHRDVKPSNILLDEKGNVKLCDFGISGRLVDSKAKTKNAGCAAYMAPERIEPPDPRKPDYDIRADVWSLGITLVELATGVFPYKDCKCDFEVLSRVLNEDPPSLPSDPSRFSPEFQSFVSSCLTKDYSERPKYKKLLEHQFLKKYEIKEVDVAEWYARAISNTFANSSSPLRYTPTSLSSATRRQPPPLSPSLHTNRRLIIESSRNDSDRYSPLRSYNSSPAPEHQSRMNGYEFPTRNDQYDSSLCTRRKYFLDSLLPKSSNHTGTNDTSMYKKNFVNGSANTTTLQEPSEGVTAGSTSPLVLQRFYHQQNQHHLGRQYLSTHSRSSSLSPSRRYLTENSRYMNDARLEDGPVKRFSSYLKFQLGAEESCRKSPTPPSRHLSPSPTPPSPPPRLNRISSLGSSSSVTPSSCSPSLYRRATSNSYYENSISPLPVRRIIGDNSPSLPRRYLSPCPPQAPPRRMSESSDSVPDSPQHFYLRRGSTRFHYTPQPQRKTLFQMDDL